MSIRIICVYIVYIIKLASKEFVQFCLEVFVICLVYKNYFSKKILSSVAKINLYYKFDIPSVWYSCIHEVN